MIRILTVLLCSMMALSISGSNSWGQANTTCWKSIPNPDGSNGNKQCEIKEVPGEPTGTATLSHTETSSGGVTTRVEDGTVTYDRTTGNATNGSGQITDHFQFSAVGKTMTHTHTEYAPDGTPTSTVQAYTWVNCKQLKRAKKKAPGSLSQ